MIGPGVVHVWRLGLALPPPLARVLDEVLTPAERARRDSYADRAVRRRFLAVYGSLRVILGSYRGEPPARVPLRTGRWGKPLLGDGTLRFNISHSGRCALLAVSAGRDVGVDVEQAPAGRSVEVFSRRYFPPAEARLVATAPPADRAAVHLTLWTRKEACVKAAGDRLLNGLDLPVAGPDGLLVHRPGGRIPGPWRVRDLRVPPGYRGAVALAGTEAFDVGYHVCRPVDLARAAAGSRPLSLGRPFDPGGPVAG
ncbi:4'-phosphopantetheinyl transferase [Micromonospora humidisoli]|uniref:4'-phosphopantetheinyl transferase superfamily protein n=1 Tax=Micromonospora humidisoli TaxID=2807622 RepID=A0ABS2JBB0_9ACTN|nr:MULTISPECIES: 4'-phosphopantetheinyl transferase superfamily protein [Micromonospora]MBM7083832.1 4'-phosphopantetheinyl transferase superfamily protein [Micromonospora humidisoli]GHJ06950.1 4'-phosphopantetheinyl transferase [Micromonospora sp. AKA109]